MTLDNENKEQEGLLPDQTPEGAMEAPEDSGATHWGPWSTIGLTALLIIMCIVFQAVTILALLGSGVFGPVPDATNQFMSEYATHGALLGWATFMAGLASVALTILFIRVKSDSISEYLALAPIPASTVYKWIGLSFILVTFSDIALNYLIDRPFLPEWWIRVWESGRTSIGLYMGFIIAAPIFEETLFRGFAYRGIAESKAGPWAAILLTSIAWGLLHSQYEFVDTIYVMMCGILLGVARWKTGSLYTVVAMHAFINLLAIIQAAYFLEGQALAFGF